MANTSARMLRLLSLLQTHRFWPGGELASRLEVSERTLRRDIERLRDLGYPVQASRGVAGGYQLRSGAAMPPLLVDDEEAVAIAVGLCAAADVAGGVAEPSIRALSKVVQVMPPRLRRRMEALRSYTVAASLWQGPAVDAVAMTVLAQACRDDERLRFGYTARDGQHTTRLVEPHRLVSLDRRWYLVAWDAERHGWRTFRVDRLTRPEPTGARFRQRELPCGDAAAFVRRSVASVSQRNEIVLVVRAPAERVRAVVASWGTVTERDPESCLLRMNVDSFAWPALVLAAVGADFEVVSPPELGDYLRETGQRFLRAGLRTRS
ncbi:putative transcriptional regulator [Saccharomonospora marina XMU15]|uniref:Putative transcriptional regulator n=1 Tax=Saccharomonospora marina XMU15 TaxID=882083 RepID=H5X5M5_9PSEU|nr:YafY family protein [Saccharomonospora marina]EHR51173.1 putative transcriptional regulator [Saccharomonospora marina XMU15]